MKTRGIDANGDWLFGKGQSDFVVNEAAIAQNIQTQLQSFLGDCFFDTSLGVDWFNLMGTKNQLQLQLSVTATILGVYGVTSLASPAIVNLDANRRNILIEYSVNTIFTGTSGSSLVGIANIFLTTEDGDFITDESGNALEGG